MIANDMCTSHLYLVMTSQYHESEQQDLCSRLKNVLFIVASSSPTCELTCTLFKNGVMVRSLVVPCSPEQEPLALAVIFRNLGMKKPKFALWHFTVKHSFIFSNFMEILRIPYSLYMNTQEHIPAEDWPVFLGADDRVVENQHLLDFYKSRLVFNFALRPKSLSFLLEGADVRIMQRQEPSQTLTPSKNKKILLISYFTEPAQTVATHRLSYWNRHLEAIASESQKDLDVHTVTPCGDSGRNAKFSSVIHLPDYGPRTMRFKHSDFYGLYKDAQNHKSPTISCSWLFELEDFFEQYRDHFDYILCSGNPFFYFGVRDLLRSWTKRPKVLLDFRDPFANNPRMNVSLKTRSWQKEQESSYTRQADAVISVNQTCLDLIECSNERVQCAVIENGYDESRIDAIEAAELPVMQEGQCRSLVYAGSFFQDRHPNILLRSLPDNYRLIHVGRENGCVHESMKNTGKYHSFGQQSYDRAVSIIKSCDLGVVFTHGHVFEQTTKIFDYIGCGKEVLIVTNGSLQQGELAKLTDEINGVHWIENNEDAISSFFETYQPAKKLAQDTNKFSRRAISRKLIDLIFQL